MAQFDESSAAKAEIVTTVGGLVTVKKQPPGYWRSNLEGDTTLTVEATTLRAAVGTVLLKSSDAFIRIAQSMDPVTVDDRGVPYQMPELPLGQKTHQQAGDAHERQVVMNGLIEVVQRSHDMMASVAGDRRIWRAGSTLEEAVGSVAQTHGDFLIAAAQSLPDQHIPLPA